MGTRRIFGLVIFVVGIILLVVGINSSQKLPDATMNKISGRFTQNTMIYIIGGVALIVGGVALTLRRKR